MTSLAKSGVLFFPYRERQIPIKVVKFNFLATSWSEAALTKILLCGEPSTLPQLSVQSLLSSAKGPQGSNFSGLRASRELTLNHVLHQRPFAISMNRIPSDISLFVHSIERILRNGGTVASDNERLPPRRSFIVSSSPASDDNGHFSSVFLSRSLLMPC